MIAEAIERITALSVGAEGPKVFQLPGDPDHAHMIQNPDGTCSRIYADPPPRRYFCNDMDSLIRMGKSHFDKGIAGSKEMVCLYNETQVELIFSHITGHESASMPLYPSVEHRFFAPRFDSPIIDVAELRGAIRAHIREAITNPALEEQIGHISFDNTDRATVSSAKGRESMGKQITESVASGTELPDTLQTFNVRLYRNADMDMRFPLVCVLEPDPKTRRWFLMPLESSWTELVNATMNVIGSRLADGIKDIPTYRGGRRP